MSAANATAPNPLAQPWSISRRESGLFITRLQCMVALGHGLQPPQRYLFIRYRRRRRVSSDLVAGMTREREEVGVVGSLLLGSFGLEPARGLCFPPAAGFSRAITSSRFPFHGSA